jgi:hypothetical protein
VSFRCRELDTFHTWSTHLLLVLRDSGLHVVHDSANNQVCGYCQVMYLSFALRLLTTLVSFDHWTISPLPYGFWPLWYLHTFGHWIICPLPYGFWLPLWYLLVIELSVLCVTTSDYHFDIFWSLNYLSSALRLLINTLISFGHWIICPLRYDYWLPLWYLLVIELSVFCLTASDYHFDIFWPLNYLSFALRLLITTLISFGHWIICPLRYDYWLPLWYLLVIELSVLCLTASDYHFDIFWPLNYLSFALRLLITTLISFGHWIICPLRYDFWLTLWYLHTVGHWIICPLRYGFWPLWCLHTFLI